MPRYDYFCPHCHKAFEALTSVNDRYIECACGSEAERRPYSGIPYLKGETVARSIPDEAYRFDAEKRAFQADWGGNDRSLALLRKNLVEDDTAFKKIDIKGMNNEW